MLACSRFCSASARRTPTDKTEPLFTIGDKRNNFLLLQKLNNTLSMVGITLLHKQQR